MDAESICPNTVHVLVGPNGSGKSRWLGQLCEEFLRRKEHVLAIAPTIYDRFQYPGRKQFKFLGGRQGRGAPARVLREALSRTGPENAPVLKNLATALSYAQFEPCIGIGLSGLNLKKLASASRKLPGVEAKALQAVLLKWQDAGLGNPVLRLSLDSHAGSEIDPLTLALLARHERLLRKARIIAGFQFCLYRDSRPIPLREACSGEVWLLATVAFISTHIQRHCVIAIDEPDTSLHPTWQRDYVRTLLNLFYPYEPRILISTQSPIILSGAEYAQAGAMRSELFVYRMVNGQAHPVEYKGLSVEALYDRLFDLITPRNYHLSQRTLSLLNDLNTGGRDLQQVLQEVEELRAKSYDESQKAVLTKVEEMALRVAAAKRQAQAG